MNDRNKIIKVKAPFQSPLQSYSSYSTTPWNSQNHTPPNSRTEIVEEVKEEKKIFNKMKCSIL